MSSQPLCPRGEVLVIHLELGSDVDNVAMLFHPSQGVEELGDDVDEVALEHEVAMLFHPSQGVAELGDDVDEALEHDVAMLFTPARATWGSDTVR